jgi:hypothetical protein
MKKIPVLTPSFIFRPFLFLVIGLGLGYWFGYTDAWRGEGTLGAKAAMLKYRISPSGGVADQRAKNVQKMKEHITAKTGIDSVLPP